jgi:hypothetical protein
MIDIILPAEWYTEAAIRQWPHLEEFAVIAMRRPASGKNGHALGFLPT